MGGAGGRQGPTNRLLVTEAAGAAERAFLWPLRDEARQLELFLERVAPLV